MNTHGSFSTILTARLLDIEIMVGEGEAEHLPTHGIVLPASHT